jgi:hypothetical protein
MAFTGCVGIKGGKMDTPGVGAKKEGVQRARKIGGEGEWREKDPGEWRMREGARLQ